MESDQLIKRVEWLDEERRTDKSVISELQKRIAKLEGALDKADEQLKEMDSEVTRLGVLIGKIDEFDAAIETYRSEVKDEFKAQQDQLIARGAELQKEQDKQSKKAKADLADLRKELKVLPQHRKELDKRKDEHEQLQRTVLETQGIITEVNKAEGERKRALDALEEDRRKDVKRVTDLQGEISAVRKRTDEFLAKIELAAEGQRKLDNRLNELVTAEADRRSAQAAFIENTSAEMADRQRIWQEWSTRFEEMQTQTGELEQRLKEIAEVDREVAEAQKTFEALTQQFTRRINEITEMQRIGEERIRQEWSTFKADDQKRWTNYTLTQEEQHKETGRQIEQLAGQLTDAEDNLQDLQDVVQHISEQSEKQLQTLLTTLRDWVAENERFFSSLR